MCTRRQRHSIQSKQTHNFSYDFSSSPCIFIHFNALCDSVCVRSVACIRAVRDDVCIVQTFASWLPSFLFFLFFFISTNGKVCCRKEEKIRSKTKTPANWKCFQCFQSDNTPLFVHLRILYFCIAKCQIYDLVDPDAFTSHIAHKLFRWICLAKRGCQSSRNSQIQTLHFPTNRIEMNTSNDVAEISSRHFHLKYTTATAAAAVEQTSTAQHTHDYVLFTSGPVNQVKSRIKSNINHIWVRFVARPFLPFDSRQTLWCSSMCARAKKNPKTECASERRTHSYRSMKEYKL